MSDHDCEMGWVRVDDRTVRYCPICAERRVAATLPAPCRSGWDGWVDIPALRDHVKTLRRWRGDPWAITICQRDGQMGTGAGKTRAVCGVARTWARHGKVVDYWEAVEFLQAVRGIIRDGPDPRGPGDLFILDDLLVEACTDWVQEVINSWISALYNEGRATIVVTNGSMAAIRARYPRVASRLSEGIVLEWIAPDYRVGRKG